jgi:DNA-binding NtrC family response regulator
LLLGESGTGKELAARSLHRRSRRANQVFITINCATIPTTLADATFFGHERGAFTDARESRAGLFEQASGGTLFLDEIGELPTEIQVKLLRVLQEREVLRVGGRQPIKVDVRVIAATNRNLEEAVSRGTFRNDLFWRLNGFAVTLPPLRDRRQDIPLLIEHLMDRLASQLGVPGRQTSDATRDELVSRDWPGNIRELEQVLQRAMILCDDSVIEPAHLAPASRNVTSTASVEVDSSTVGTLDDLVRRTTDRVERSLIENALAQCQGNQTRAAAMLGISRRTLFTKLKRLNLNASEDTADPDSV